MLSIAVAATLSSSLGLAAGTNLVLDLQSCKSLMEENLTKVSSMEVEVRVAEVNECNASNEQNQPGVVSLTGGLERIVTNFVTVRQVMNVVLFLPGVAASV